MYSQFAKAKNARANYPNYSGATSMVARYLTSELYEKLFGTYTSTGASVDKCIQPSLDDKTCRIGLCAADDECFETFKDLFDPIISDLHNGFAADAKHPDVAMEPDNLKAEPFDSKYVHSSCIHVRRNIKGMPLMPSISRAERREIERILKEILDGMKDDLAGKYYSIPDVSEDEKKQLTEDHFFFEKPSDHLMMDSGSSRDYPNARGIWHNNDKNLLVWINEQDHIRVFALNKDGNIKDVYSRLCKALKEIEAGVKSKEHDFARHDRLGFLSLCPSKIGCALQCSVHVQLKHLGKHVKFASILKCLELEACGAYGEETPEDGIYGISNASSLGKTEDECVQQAVDGINKLIQMEKQLEEGKSIDDLIPDGA